MTNSAAHSSTRVVLIALAVNIAIAASKAFAAVLTGSSAMLSETVHSCVDCINQVLMLVGIKRSTQPADDLHPLGYDREIYFWSVVVSVAVFAGGGMAALYDGIMDLLHPSTIAGIALWGYRLPGWGLNLILLVVALMLESQGFRAAYKELRRNEKAGRSSWTLLIRSVDPSLFVVLFEDGAAVLGLAVTLLATVATALTGNDLFDAIGAIATGVLLTGVALVMFNETRSLVIGEANPSVSKRLREIVLTVEGVAGINACVTQHLGPQAILALLSVDWQNDLRADAVEAATARIHAAVKAAGLNVSHLFVEARDASTLP